MKRSSAAAMLAAIVLAYFASPQAATAQSYTFKTLVNFNDNNGSAPLAGLTLDAAGNLYGTTSQGGSDEYGTVFKLDASHAYAISTLANFTTATGQNPQACVTLGAGGNLYGTTYAGGTGGYGTVFKLTAASGYAISTLANFTGANGINPQASIAIDGTGNIYGTTYQGGATAQGLDLAYGTVFKLDASNGYALSTLVNFNYDNGMLPQAGVIMDASGNLYGTTNGGGAPGWGTVFKLDASNHYALSTLSSFASENGGEPMGGVIMDSRGNLYGTTSGQGGGNGTIFKLDASNHYALSTLVAFTGTNGGTPMGNLIMDGAGNLYGTTSSGGTAGGGTVFKLNAASGYALSTLVNFAGANGQSPQAGLAMDAVGDIFGTTNDGGANGDGTVFELLANHIPGDINGDGLVDVADYNIWAANVGRTGATWSQGDLNGDGLVDVADYNIWAANVGKTAGTPEPASLSLVAIGGLAFLRRRIVHPA